MPFDGIITHRITKELHDRLVSGRVDKIYQPERDEIILLIRNHNQNCKLLLSSNSQFPRLHITDQIKENPISAPVFCMLLRKHLQGGRILSVTSEGFERVVTVSIENTNELGDYVIRRLVIEIMGRHSNIILLNHENKILDAIKHIDFETSRVREVMPGRLYFAPPKTEKQNPLIWLKEPRFSFESFDPNLEIGSFLVQYLEGCSPFLAKEIVTQASLSYHTRLSEVSTEDIDTIIFVLQKFLKIFLDTTPVIYYKDEARTVPFDFYCTAFHSFPYQKTYASVSQCVDRFYSEKDSHARLLQKKQELYKVISQHLSRLRKKHSIYEQNLSDVLDKESLKLYGELITANIWRILPGEREAWVENYYEENQPTIRIPLDEALSPQDNAQRFFKKYQKAKSTYANSSLLLEEVVTEMLYLEQVRHQLDEACNFFEIEEIRLELKQEKYLKDNSKEKKQKRKQQTISSPLEYISSDGLSILVGKNNLQNDRLTMKQVNNNDLWFHTKDIPGSHVVIRKQEGLIPETTILDAAMLAAYHSKAKLSAQVPVDYTFVKHVKKPPKAKPGMVTYSHAKTIYVTPSEEFVKRMKNLS